MLVVASRIACSNFFHLMYTRLPVYNCVYGRSVGEPEFRSKSNIPFLLSICGDRGKPQFGFHFLGQIYFNNVICYDKVEKP